MIVFVCLLLGLNNIFYHYFSTLVAATHRLWRICICLRLGAAVQGAILMAEDSPAHT